MGKRRRIRKQRNDLAGLEDLGTDREDDKAHIKRTREEGSSEEIPLMEGEGKSLRVKGFNQSQRTKFTKVLMRFGTGEYDWAEFVPRLKHKTLQEIHEYGELLLRHLLEEMNESLTFEDGVPKEGLKSDDVLFRIATLGLIREKLQQFSGGAPVFTNDYILARHPEMKGGRVWKEQHDWLLLRGVMKHGYGRWQAIADDKDLKLHQVISEELNLSRAQSQPHISAPGVSQPQNDGNSENIGNAAPGDEAKESDLGADTAAPSQPSQEQSTQIKHAEFVRRRVLLLERGLQIELHHSTLDAVHNDEPENPSSEA